MNQIELFQSYGYRNVKVLPAGGIAGTMKMSFTTGLFVGLDSVGYQRRYCYEREADAVSALKDWDGAFDPPGPWIKEKPSDRLGPGARQNEA